MALLVQAVRKRLMGVDNVKIGTASMENTVAEVLTALFWAEKKGWVVDKTTSSTGYPMLSPTGSK
jgi:hypothetical protein